jgi:hypothetical protein
MFFLKESCLSSAVLTALLWFCCLPATHAQIVHDRVYGTATGQETLYSMTQLQAGGYVMAGSQEPRNISATNPCLLYILRLNAVGDTIWTRRWMLSGCFNYYPFHTVETGRGNFLISGQSYTYDGITQGDAFLAMFNAQGDTLWTKRVASIAQDEFAKPQVLPNGDILIAGQLNNAPSLQRLTSSGQVVWEQYPIYSASTNGSVGLFFPAPTTGQYWVLLSAGGGFKFVQYDANGTVGTQIPGSPDFTIADIVVDGNGFLIANSTDVRRLDASFNTLWTRATTSGGTNFHSRRLLTLPNGNIAVGSDSYASMVAVYTLSPSGQVLHDTTFWAPGRQYLKGLAVDPPTGDYVFAGYSEPGPIGRADIFWTQLHHRIITSTRASQVAGQRWLAYPNPLAADGRLYLQGEQPLHGTLHLRDALGRQLTTWVAAGQLAQMLTLPPTLPTGTYLLTLESPNLPPRTLRLVQP